MPCPGAYPLPCVPAKTPPPRAVLNSMAMQAAMGINDAMQGLKPYVEGRELPKGVSQSAIVLSASAMVYSSLTSAGLPADAPAGFGDVLVAANPKTLKREFRDCRKAIMDFFESDNWPRPADKAHFRSKKSGVFFGEALDVMHLLRAAYLLDSAKVTNKMTKKQRKKTAGYAKERDKQVRASYLNDGQKAAVAAAMSAGASFDEALKGAENV